MFSLNLHFIFIQFASINSTKNIVVCFMPRLKCQRRGSDRRNERKLLVMVQQFSLLVGVIAASDSREN